MIRQVPTLASTKRDASMVQTDVVLERYSTGRPLVAVALMTRDSASVMDAGRSRMMSCFTLGSADAGSPDQLAPPASAITIRTRKNTRLGISMPRPGVAHMQRQIQSTPGKHRSTGTFVTRVRRRLSLAHVHDTTGTRSQDLDQAQVDAVTITGFLHHLKTRTAGLQGDLAAKSSPHSGSNRRSPSSDPKGGPPGQTQPQTHAEPGITVGDDALHTVRDRRRNAAPASLRTGTLVSSEPFAFVVP